MVTRTSRGVRSAIQAVVRVVSAMLLLGGVVLLAGQGVANAQDGSVDTSCINADDPDYNSFEVDSDDDGVVDARDPAGPCDPDVNPYPCDGDVPRGEGGDPSYDPNFSDADGDGASDAAEVTAGTNPCPPDGASETPDDPSTPTTVVETTTTLPTPTTVVVPTTVVAVPTTVAPTVGPTVCGVLQAVTYDAATADTDSDGLTDAAEIAAGLNQCAADTDGDGLEDGQEVNVLGTVASNADTDGDGMADGAEVAAGRNPLLVEVIAFTGLRNNIQWWGVSLLFAGLALIVVGNRMTKLQIEGSRTF